MQIKITVSPKLMKMVKERATSRLYDQKRAMARVRAHLENLILNDLDNSYFEDVEFKNVDSVLLFVQVADEYRIEMQKRAQQLGLRNVTEYVRTLMYLDLLMSGDIEEDPLKILGGRIRK